MIRLVKASVADLQAIHDMAEVVFRHTYKEILSAEQMDYMMDMMYSLTNLKSQLEEGHHYYISYEEDIPIGYMSVQYEGDDEDGVRIFHLHKIYVMPSCQGRGIGKVLFDKALQHVRECVHDMPARIELNVNRNNPSLDFYRHLGMRILRQGDFPIGHGYYMNDYIMGLDII